jgi:hypothetical protein
MLKRKKKVSLSNASIEIHCDPAPSGMDPKCDFINGSPVTEEVYNTKGTKVQLEAVLIQTHHSDPYRLMFMVGGRWLLGGVVPSGDEFVAQLEADGLMTIKGKSPLEIKQLERQAQQEQERIDADRAYKAERARVNRERIAREASKNAAKRGYQYA